MYLVSFEWIEANTCWRPDWLVVLLWTLWKSHRSRSKFITMFPASAIYTFMYLLSFKWNWNWRSYASNLPLTFISSIRTLLLNHIWRLFPVSSFQFPVSFFCFFLRRWWGGSPRRWSPPSPSTGTKTQTFGQYHRQGF